MKFKFLKKSYSLKTVWEEITLREAIALSRIEIDEKTLEKLHKEEDPDNFTTGEIELMREYIKILSFPNISKFVDMDNAFVFVLFSYVKELIYHLYYLNIETYKPIGIQEFKFKDKTYYLPETLNVNGEQIIGYKERSKFVTEANNLMNHISKAKGKGVEALNLLAALYIKEDKDEVYDDERVAKRAEVFYELPMSIVWEVFFYIYFFYINYAIASKVSLEDQKTSRLRRIGLTMLGLLVLPIRGLLALWKMLKRCLSGNCVKS